MRCQQYLDDIISGKQVAGELVRKAVDRHFRDIEASKTDAFPYYYDDKLAESVVQLYPILYRHYKGKWKGKPFELEPWEQFAECSMTGWRHKETHLRRFKKGYVSVARKNGKTFYAACKGTSHLIADHPLENAPECYCTSSKHEQSKIVFNDMKALVKSSPRLSGMLKVYQNAISYEAMNGTIQPLGADRPFSGLNPSFVIKDEIHEMRSRHREFSDTMSTGGAARAQPFELIITTAGDDESAIWLEEVDYAERVLNGIIEDETLFALIYCLDPEDDPLNPDVWEKANPNLGVSVSLDYLVDQAKRAENDPTMLNRFLRYHGNVKTTSREKAITPALWARGKQSPVFEGIGHGGFDLGRSDDWASAAIDFHQGDEHHLLTRHWACEDAWEWDREPYKRWRNTGLVSVHDGDQLDFSAIEMDIAELNKTYQVQTWAYDPTFARQMAQRLSEEYGLEIFAFTQTHRFYNEPIRKFLEALKAAKVFHGGDPVLAWQADNLGIHKNAKDEWLPDKTGSKGKIDGMVAVLMAFSECLFAEGDSGSVYDQGESLLL